MEQSHGASGSWFSSSCSCSLTPNRDHRELPKEKKRDENRKKQHRIPTEFPVSGLPGCLDTTNPYPTMREGACFTARSAWDRLLARCHGLLCCNLDWSGQSPVTTHPRLVLPEDGRTGGGGHPPNTISLTGKGAHMVKPRKCSAFWEPGLSINHHLASPQILGHGSKLWLSVFPTRVPPDVRLVWICTDLGLRGPTWQCRQLGSSSTGAFPGYARSWFAALSGQSIHVRVCFRHWSPIHLLSHFCRDLNNKRQQSSSTGDTLFLAQPPIPNRASPMTRSLCAPLIRSAGTAHGSAVHPAPLNPPETSSS